MFIIPKCFNVLSCWCTVQHGDEAKVAEIEMLLENLNECTFRKKYILVSCKLTEEKQTSKQIIYIALTSALCTQWQQVV